MHANWEKALLARLSSSTTSSQSTNTSNTSRSSSNNPFAVTDTTDTPLHTPFSILHQCLNETHTSQQDSSSSHPRKHTTSDLTDTHPSKKTRTHHTDDTSSTGATITLPHDPIDSILSTHAASQSTPATEKEQQHDWSMKQTIVLTSPSPLELDRKVQDPVIAHAALTMFIQSTATIQDLPEQVAKYARWLSHLYSWQYPAVQPTLSDQPTSSMTRAEREAAHQRSTQWLDAFDSLCHQYLTTNTDAVYFYYIAAHMTVLFGNASSPTQDKFAYIASHTSTLPNYLTSHDIPFCRPKTDALFVATDQQPMQVQGIENIRKLLQVARQWQQHPTYLRRLTLPYLYAPIPFQYASIYRANISSESTVLTSPKQHLYRTEIQGPLLALNVYSLTQQLQHLPQLHIRWQSTPSTTTFSSFPIKI